MLWAAIFRIIQFDLYPTQPYIPGKVLKRLNIPIDQIYAEIDRNEREPYGAKKINWRHSLIPIALWFSAYVLVFLDVKLVGQPSLTSVIVAGVLLAVLTLLVFAKSLEQAWTQAIITKVVAESVSWHNHHPVFGKKNWQNTVYNPSWVFTSERWKFNLYKLAKYFCYGISYPVIFAIGVLAVISWLYQNPSLGS